MDAIIIDPTRLNDQTKPLLQALLDCPPEKTLNAGEFYPLKFFSGRRIVELTLCLSHTIDLYSYKSKPFQCKADVYAKRSELNKGREPEVEGVLEIAEDVYYKPKGKVKRLVNFFEKLTADDPNKSQERVLQTINIDPTNLTDKTRPLLQAFLDKTNKIKFRRSKIYYVELHTDFHTVEIPIRLKNSLLIRPKKSDPALDRIEVLDGLIGRGGEGAVYNSLGTLEVENDLYFNSIPKKEHVIKAIPLARVADLSAEEIVEQAEQIRKIQEKPVIKEALKTNWASDFLRCHAALFSKQNGYLVMNRAEGDDLYDLLDKLAEGKIRLSETGYILLTLKLITAVAELHKKGLMHRDLKSENVIVDLKNWKIVIIDHRSVRQVPADDPTKELRCKFRKGTLTNMPPESLGQEKIISQAGDLYALGIIIAELWGDQSLADFMMSENQTDIPALLAWQKKDKRFDLFDQMNVSVPVQKVISTIVYGLTQYKASDRMSLAVAGEWCELLLQSKKEHSYSTCRKSKEMPSTNAEPGLNSKSCPKLDSEKESGNDNSIRI